MELENAGTSRAAVAEVLKVLAVDEKRSGLESWLEDNYPGVEVNGKPITVLVMSDIESYPEYYSE